VKTREQKAAYQRAYKEKNKERRKAYEKEYREKNREREKERGRLKYLATKGPLSINARARHLRVKYGMTVEQKAAMSEAQGNRCAICEQAVYLVVDHCHDTNKVRGLLCKTCNQGLGLLKDSLLVIRNAVRYLEKFPKTPSAPTDVPSRPA
jgi:hypothetical protein